MGGGVGAVRTVGAVGAVGAWAHMGSLGILLLLKQLQGRPSEDNGRGAVGAVREGGDDVEWVGKALTAVETERVWNGGRSAENGVGGGVGGGGGGVANF